MKIVVHLLTMGIILGLLLVVPRMLHQHQSIVKTCAVLLGKSQKEGMITSQTYREFQERLSETGLLDQVHDVVIRPGIDMAVQKRQAISIELEISYGVEVPFVGKKQYFGDYICLQAFSHKYFK